MFYIRFNTQTALVEVFGSQIVLSLDQTARLEWLAEPLTSSGSHLDAMHSWRHTVQSRLARAAALDKGSDVPP